MELTTNTPKPIPRRIIVLTLGAALLTRLTVLASGAVSFHSDEAVVALMARHIDAGGAIPTFFYGQPYMGSLDALLVALGFRLFGEGVAAIRIVQLALYLCIVLTTVLLAWRLTQREIIAASAGLLLAFPPVVFTLYTSMTLGGYAETLLLGNLLLLLGWQIIHAERPRTLDWIALGLLAGLGWWTNALIAVYCIPVGLLLLRHLHLRQVGFYALAILAFFIGGAPWWVYNLQHDWQALAWLLGTSQNNNGLTFTLPERAFGFLFIGLPAALGVRYPWVEAAWSPIAAVFYVAGVFALLDAAWAALRQPNRRYLMLMVGGFAAVFVLSAFGSDITGRYLLPLVPIFAILYGMLLARLWDLRRELFYAALGGLLALQGAANLNAMAQPPGLTSQFDLVNHIPNDHDQALIDFLMANGGTRGFATYWITFRIAFLSGERIILDAWLPNKESLIYTAVDRRYPPYTEAALAAEHPVYVTANVPALDRILVEWFTANAVTYRIQQIGPYTVYYELSRRVTPAELGVDRIGR